MIKRNRSYRPAIACAIGILSFGCGDEPDGEQGPEGDGTLTVQAFCEERARIECQEFYVPCCEDLAGASLEATQCERQRFEDCEFGQTDAELSGWVFHPAAAEQCLEALPDVYDECQVRGRDSPEGVAKAESCNNVWRGTIEPGGQCNFLDLDCALVPDKHVDCVIDECVALDYAQPNGRCSSESPCPPSQFCNNTETGTCEPLKEVGTPCLGDGECSSHRCGSDDTCELLEQAVCERLVGG